MTSFRDFVRDKLVDKLITDVKNLSIRNEADLQARVYQHLFKRYSRDFNLANQPRIPIGRTRASSIVKPDIVIYDRSHVPVAAFELKCFLDCENLIEIAGKVWDDFEKLRKFGSRYNTSQNTFALVLVNVSKDDYDQIIRVTSSGREPWMKQYFFPHFINVRCDKNYRMRAWYNKWDEQMRERSR